MTSRTYTLILCVAVILGVVLVIAAIKNINVSIEKPSIREMHHSGPSDSVKVVVDSLSITISQYKFPKTNAKDWISSLTGILGIIIGSASLLWHVIHFRLMHGSPANVRLFLKIQPKYDGRIVCRRNEAFNCQGVFFNEGQYGTAVLNINEKAEPFGVEIINETKEDIFGLDSLETKTLVWNIRIGDQVVDTDKLTIQIFYTFLQTSYTGSQEQVEQKLKEQFEIEIIE